MRGRVYMGVNKINVNNTDSNYTHSIFDISEYTGKSYDTLTDALADIPDGKQKGGMNVAFVLDSEIDNKYVQFRLMTNNFNTIESNWQGVDYEPKMGSKNFVENGVIVANYARQKDSLNNIDLELTDENDSAIVQFKDGHIKTKNFDSKIINNKPDTEDSIISDDDLDIVDKTGNILARYKNGVHTTKHPSPFIKEEIVNNVELDFEDENNNSILRIENGHIKTRNFDSDKISFNAVSQVKSSIGKGQMRASYDTITSNEIIELNDFPRYIDTRKFFSFIGYMTEFPNDAHFDFGVRYKYTGKYWHNGGWIRVSSTTVEIYHDDNENQSTLEGTYTHGLTFDTFIKVFMYLCEDYSFYIILETLDEKYVIRHNRDNQISLEICGHPIFMNDGITFNNAQITAGSADFKSPIWVFGDSFSNAVGYAFIGGQLKDLGLSQNICYNHLGGNNHNEAWDDLQRMLQFGTPRMIVWLLGVNGSQPNNVIITELLKTFCEANEIELVLEYPPLFPNALGIDMTNLRAKVLETGCRIINFSRAVGCHEVEVEGVTDIAWYNGYIGGDNCHPTQKGSRALVMQIINDVPEIIQWGINENPTYYSPDNN